MKIAVMGTGGVGAGFGARLAAAGSDVTFIARGKQLDAIKQRGLKVVSPLLGDIHLVPTKCTDDPATIGPVDVVLFCVKLWDTESAAHQCKPLIGAGTAVISLQNGISRDETLGRILGRKHIVGGVSYIGATIMSPGVIDQRGKVQKLVFGEYSRETTARLAEFAKQCERAGIEAIISSNIEQSLWEKFVYLVAMSSVLAATRQTIGPVRSNEKTRGLLIDVMNETIAVGRKRGVELSDSLVDHHMAYFDGLAPDVTASMQYDLSVGNRMELPWLGGTVVKLGQELNVPTPVTRTLAAILSPYAGA